MKTNSEIKLEAKAAMTNRWGQAVLFMFIYSLLSAGISTLNLVSPAIASIFLGFPLSLGIAIAFLNFSRTGELPLEKIFSAFNSTYYLKSIGVTLLSTIYTFLWCLLFIIPGIIKGLSYAMAPFIIAEDPSLSGEEAICRSMEMMEGHKMALFLIVLECLVLVLLSSLLLFIPLLWITPYYMTVITKFYEALKTDSI